MSFKVDYIVKSKLTGKVGLITKDLGNDAYIVDFDYHGKTLTYGQDLELMPTLAAPAVTSVQAIRQRILCFFQEFKSGDLVRHITTGDKGKVRNVWLDGLQVDFEVGGLKDIEPDYVEFIEDLPKGFSPKCDCGVSTVRIGNHNSNCPRQGIIEDWMRE